MKKILFASVALTLFIFAPAGAVDKKGKIGIGFFNDDAPIGARYWITDRYGFDLGFGLNIRNVVDSTINSNLLPAIVLDPSKKTLAEFRFDAGFPVNVIRTEKVNFLIRPGFSYQGVPFFDLFFRDSVQLHEVVIDVDTLPNGDLFDVKDTIEVPFGQVLDTVKEEKSRSFDINFTLGIEYFPVDNFSVSLFHGIGARNSKRAKGEDGFWTVTSRPFFKGTNIGFRYYF
jgi:hypothetical protein